MGLGNDEIVDIEVMVIFGVGDRRLQALLDVDRDPLARELQVGERGRSLAAADQLRDKIELLRGNPQHPGDCLGLVIGEAPFALWFAHRLILKPSWLSCRPNGRGRSASARTRRTCDRPFPRSPKPARASGRCRRRTPGRRTAAGWSSGGSRS